MASIDPTSTRLPDTGWSSLGRGAKLFRIAHTAWSVASLASLGYVWRCALARRWDRPLVGAVAFLSLEGLALVVGRGDCPMAPLQRHLGDPVPLFELLLSPPAAKSAIPVLSLVTVGGFVALLLRMPARTAR